MEYEQLIADCMNGNIDDLDSSEIVQMLQAADDLYYNDDSSSFLTDAQYDAIRNIAQKLDPTNTYFLGVGSEIRTGKIALPFEMGSLDQVEIGSILEWVNKWSLNKEVIIVSDKLDGVSAMLIYKPNGQPQIAYSRGDGVQGADITRHIFKIKSVPSKISCGMAIRAEVILSDENFKKLQPLVNNRAGKQYKNARNMVSGLMNAKENPPIVYDYLDVVVYQILDSEDNKEDQLSRLDSENFDVVMWSAFYGKDINDEMLAEHLEYRRNNSPYALDGVVLDVNDAAKRSSMNPRKDTLNPAYSIKYKVADASNIARTRCIEVEWNISKHGYWKPRVRVEAVELVGVTVQHASGFNAKFIVDNKIGPGSILEITRSGDVIPFIVRVIEPAEAQLPKSEFVWTDSGVDIYELNAHENEEVMLKQVTDFFASIDAPHLKMGNVQQMFMFNVYDNTEDALVKMLHHDQFEWTSAIGANGVKIFEGLKKKMRSMPLWLFAGSMPTLGRGIGRKKIKKLQKALGFDKLLKGDFTYQDVLRAEGYDDITANQIMQNWSGFLSFYDKVKDVVNLVDDATAVLGDAFAGQKVVFTGFRDKTLEEDITAAGGEIQSGVSGKTTLVVAKNPNENSGKLKKAREKGIKVIGEQELREMLA